MAPFGYGIQRKNKEERAMEKVWLESYPMGVPAEINPSQYTCIVDMLEESFQKYRERDAFSCLGVSLTYGQLDELTANLAVWFQEHGICRGARVALMLPNLLQQPVAMIAVLRLGCVVVNVNPFYTAHELLYQLRDSGAEAIVILDSFASVLEKCISKTAITKTIITSVGDLMGFKGIITNFVFRHIQKKVPVWNIKNHTRFNDALEWGAKSRAHTVRSGKPVCFVDTPIQSEEIAFLQYTGGTTGVAKGAMLSHRNIVANALQSEAWISPILRRVDQHTQYVTAAALPLYHIFSLMVCSFLTLRSGGLSLLIPNPRDISSLIKAMNRTPCHLFPGVNTIYSTLLNHPDFSKLNLSKLLIAQGGGMAVQEVVARRWFEATGVPIIEGYGLTETSPCAISNSMVSSTFSGTIGVPIPSTEVSIRNEEGQEVPIGELGEICIRGPQVMLGYWNNIAETQQVMTADHFLKTGDLGYMDAQGFIKLVERKKDMILVSGFNVYPNEIEDIVMRHPGVLEAAAVGIPDARSGEAVKLCVSRKDPQLTEKDLRNFCRENLTGYKCPKVIEFLPQLPKTNIGKILRRALRDNNGGVA